MSAVADARKRVKIRDDVDFAIIDLDRTNGEMIEFIVYSPQGTLTKPYHFEQEAIFLRGYLLRLMGQANQSKLPRDAEFISSVPIPGPEMLYRVTVRTFIK